MSNPPQPRKICTFNSVCIKVLCIILLGKPPEIVIGCYWRVSEDGSEALGGVEGFCVGNVTGMSYSRFSKQVLSQSSYQE